MKIKWKGAFLWSNQFYGLCAILLAMESNLILLQKLPNFFLLLFIHIATVLYYTHAYLQENQDGIYNQRSKWYQENKKYIQIRQIIYTLICIWLVFFKLKIYTLFLESTVFIKATFLISLFISVIYYIPNYTFIPIYSFRKKGIFKSISIAWIWTLFSCILPIWFVLGDSIINMIYKYVFWKHFTFLFFFIFVLSILFDVKDLNRDKKEAINTIVAIHGISFTVTRIILPILIAMFFFETIGFVIHLNSQWNFIANTFLLIITYYTSRKVVYIKSIQNNLLLIDGLILIKAILSIVIFFFIH